MRFFLLLLDPDSRWIPEEVCRSYEAMPRRRGLELSWQNFATAAVLTSWDDPHGDPLLAEHGGHLAAGMVRLDNRDDVERWAECRGEELPDLGVALRLVALHGTRYISRILGDFAFVVWDTASRTGVAATDAFAVRPLYYSERAGLIAWSSRAEPLAVGERYEPRYLVELLTSYTAPAGLSVYAGVNALPAASLGTLERGTVRIQRYWSPADVEVQPTWSEREAEAIDTCRALLLESIRMRLAGGQETWAQLSGGLDSSSVVSLAGWLAEHGDVPRALAGTVTYVDRIGTQTDEREYADAVARRYGLPNVAIVDPPMWYDEEYPPVAPDQPGLDFHVQPRERRLCQAVRQAGGRVLLTGYGGDEVFAGNLLFLADWITRGRLLQAARTMAHLAAHGRGSFWELAYRNVLVPLSPAPIRTRLISDDSPPGAWLERQAVRRYGNRAPVSGKSPGSRGREHQYAIAHGVQMLQGVVHGGILSDAFDLRHPLLYRPLVEFALSLPHQLRYKAHLPRWILRQALRGVLPDTVRSRVGKPDTSDVLVRSLDGGRAHLRALLERPLLAEMGLIDPARLRAAFDETLLPGADMLARHIALFPTLAVEAWLQIRSGRWPLPGHLSCNSTTGAVDSTGAVEGESRTHKVSIAVQSAPLAAG
jgi:asparagine synthase (glutamine-hydrolysing)